MNIWAKLGRSCVVGAYWTAAIGLGAVQAQVTGVWNRAAGNWSTVLSPVPLETNDIAILAGAMAASRLVTNNASISLGGMWIGHSGNNNYAVTLNKAGSSTITFTNLDGTSAFLIKTNNTGASATGTDTINTSISLGANLDIFNLSTSGKLTLAGILSESGGSRGITISGGAGVTLSGANTYTGGTTLNDGTLLLGHNAALGTGSLTINGGKLNVTAARVLTNITQNWNGDFEFIGANTLDLGNGAVTLGGNRKVTVTASALTVGGTISGAGMSLTKEGTGILVLNATNTYTGPTIINNGVLRLMRSEWINTSALQVNNGVVEICSNDFSRYGGITAGRIQITGGVSGFSVNGNADRNVSFGTTSASLLNMVWGTYWFNPDVFVLTASTANRNMYFKNSIDLNGQDREIDVQKAPNSNWTRMDGFLLNNAGTAAGLIKGGPGLLILNNTNTYNGSTTIAGGVLRINNPAALPSGNLVLSNGVIEFAVDVPDVNRGLGAGPNQIQLLAGGTNGFSALTGPRTINIGGNADTLVWGSTYFDPAALVLNESIGNTRLFFANGLDFNGADRNIFANGTSTGPAIILGVVTNSSGTAGLIKSGGGILQVLGSNYAYNGPTVITAGTLKLGDNWTINGYLPNTVITNNATLLVAGPYDQIISQPMVGSGSFTKNNQATVTLTGSNTYSGNTAANAGTLLLDFSAVGAPLTNLAGASAMLTGGGTIYLKGSGSSGVTNAQNFKSTTINNGLGRLIVDNNGGGTVNVALGGFGTRQAGGALDITLPIDGIVTTTTTNINGILGGYITVGQRDWATVIGTSPYTITNYTGYAALTGVGPTIADGATQNILINSTSSGTITLGAATTIINSLAMQDTMARTIDTADQTLKLVTIGGILLSPDAAALTIGTGATPGYLTAGTTALNTAGELLILNNSANALTINSAIVNNGTGANTVTFDGTGTVILMGANAYTGPTYVNKGTVIFTNNAGSTLGGNLYVNDGILRVDAPVTAAGFDVAGNSPGSRSRAFITTNLTTTAGYLRIGINDGSTADGAVFQSGGTVAVGANSIYIADAYPGYGYYNLSGGTLVNNAGAIGVGNRGNGVMDITDGIVGPNNGNFILANDRGGLGVVTVSGGTLYAGTGANRIYIGGQYYGGNYGVITVMGSGYIDAATNDVAKGLDLMANAGNTGIVNLNSGGTIYANRVYANNPAGTSVFNFNGGTLVAADGTTQGTNFLQGLMAAYIQPGGAIIDSSTNNLIINQGLLAPTGYVVTNIARTSNGSGYIGAPLVQITGGSGVGATAIAQVDFATGQITNILMTSYGSGYLSNDTLTVSLLGGGFTNPATIGTISWAPATSGGLTKNGSGMLILAGSNTFTGAINVNNGFLDLVYAAPGATNINLAAGAGMGFGIGSGNQFSIPVISNLLATKFGAENSFGLDTSSGPVTYPGVIGGISNFFKLGENTLTLPATSTYSGNAYVLGGALNAEWGAGLPSTANLILNGGAWETTNGFATNWGIGAGQLQLPGDASGFGAGGFSAYNTPLTVNLGGDGQTLVWGATNIFNPSALILNATTANTNLTLVNPLDLNGGTHTIAVYADTAYLAGGLTNSMVGAPAGLVKMGAGTLVLSNANDCLDLRANPGLSVRQGTLLMTAGIIQSQISSNFADNVGYLAGDDGTLILAGTSTYIRSNNYLYVGNATGSRGTLVVQDNAAFQSSYRLGVGWNTGATGTVYQTGGNIILGSDIYVGSSGVGTYYHLDGGLTNSGGYQYWGSNLGALGTMFQYGGTVYNAGNLLLGNALGSSGVWIQTNGSVYVNGSTYIGNSGNGRLELSGGSMTNNNVLYVGNNDGARGTVLLTGGVMYGNNVTRMGSTAGAAGAIYQTGGIARGTEMQLGYYAGGYGYLEIQGGIRTNTSWVWVGRGGMGVYYLSGGTNAVTANGMLLNAGDVNGEGRGVVYITGGVYTSAQNIVMGYNNTPSGSGRAEFNLAGDGQVLLGNVLQMNKAGSAALDVSTNIFNLNGGTLRVTAINKGAAGGQSIFNFNGGTLLAGAASTTFMQGLDAAYVHANGAVIDTAGNNITIGQNLLAPSGQGVMALPWAGTLSNYIGAPMVSLSGGSGFGATAIAQFDYTQGTVTGLVLTSAGSGYQSNDILTVTLLGISGNANTVLGTATLGDVPTTGGLTKNGAGILTLTGANTYNGPTLISAGTLQIGAGGTVGQLGTGPVTNNAILTFNRSDDVTITGLITGIGTLTKQGAGNLALNGIITGISNLNISAGNVINNGSMTLTNGGGNVGLQVQSSSVFSNSGVINMTSSKLQLYNKAVVDNAGSITNSTGIVLCESGSQTNTTLNNYTGGNIYMPSGSLYGGIYGTGTVNNLGGTLSLGGSANLWLGGGNVAGGKTNAIGTLNLEAGLVQFNSSGSFRLGSSDTNSIGVVNLNGGTLAVNKQITMGTGPGVQGFVNLNGGVLSGTTNNVTLLGSDITAVTVQSNGAWLALASGITNTLAVNLIDGGGGGGLTKLDAGTLILAGANAYSGATVISNGTIRLGLATALPTMTQLYADTLGTFDLAGWNQQVSGINGYKGTLTDSVGGGSLTVSFASGTQNFLGTVTGASTLTLTGGGTLVATTASTFGASVSNMVTGGSTLLMNGTHNGVIVTYGASTNGGSGIITTLNIMTNGVYMPGAVLGLGTQTVHNLTLNPGGLLVVGLAAASNGLVRADTSFAMTNALLQLNLANYEFSAGQTITLVNYTGATGFTAGDPGQWFTLNDVGGLSNGVVWAENTWMPINGGTGSNNFFRINYDDIANGHAITLTAVPEPGTASLFGLVGLVWLVRRIRRRQ